MCEFSEIEKVNNLKYFSKINISSYETVEPSFYFVELRLAIHFQHHG